MIEQTAFNALGVHKGRKSPHGERKEKTLSRGRSSEKRQYTTKIEQLEEGSPCPIYTEREGGSSP